MNRLSTSQSLELISQEIRKMPENSDVYSLIRSARILFGVDSEERKVTRFIYYQVLGFSSGIKPDSLGHDPSKFTQANILTKLNEWLKREAHYLRECYLNGCRHNKIEPIDTSLKDWDNAKTRALGYILCHYYSDFKGDDK